MDDLGTSISQMNKESLLNWLKENFNDDIASKFEGKSYWNTKLNFSAKQRAPKPCLSAYNKKIPSLRLFLLL